MYTLTYGNFRVTNKNLIVIECLVDGQPWFQKVPSDGIFQYKQTTMLLIGQPTQFSVWEVAIEILLP